MSSSRSGWLQMPTSCGRTDRTSHSFRSHSFAACMCSSWAHHQLMIAIKDFLVALAHLYIYVKYLCLLLLMLSAQLMWEPTLEL